MPQLKFLRTFFISFVVFGAAVYRPSFMVDYTERRKTERKKGKIHYITGPTTQKEEVLCEKEKLNFLNFYYVTMNFLRGQHFS